MAIINPTLPNDGENADAGDVNTPFLAILGVLNGGIDASNLADNAVTTAKITDGSVTDAKLADSASASWKSLTVVPTTVANLGQKSFTVLYPAIDYTSKISKGMRLKFTRSSAAPAQCTSLNGTNQYYSKSSPSGTTFTDDFAISAWIKLNNYAAGSIVSRYNGTSGWDLRIGASGQVELFGVNGGAGNYSEVISTQSVPLGRWVHIAVQLDMSAFTATSTTSYVMIDGVDVPAGVFRAGTNPTALIQAGNLEVGSRNGGTQFFPGKLAQVAVFSAKVTQATMLTYSGQTFSGSETNLISAYSFSNSITDLKVATANNLTAQGSALATNADSPFAQAVTAGLLEYGIITNVVFSTNTTVTVQVPEGSMLPTSGGLSASAYSSSKVPYGFPGQRGKWMVMTMVNIITATVNTDVAGAWGDTGVNFTEPIGAWLLSYQGAVIAQSTSTGSRGLFITLASSAPTNGVYIQALTSRFYNAVTAGAEISTHAKQIPDEVSSATLYRLYAATDTPVATETAAVYGAQAPMIITAECAYL